MRTTELAVDKLGIPEEMERFLRGLGLKVRIGVVSQVVWVLQNKESMSLYDVYAHGRKPDGTERKPICGKGTAYKIKKLYLYGHLKPFLDTLGSNKVGSTTSSEEQSEQLAVQIGDQRSTILGPEQVPGKGRKSEEMPEKTEGTNPVNDRLDQMMARYPLWYEQQENQLGESLPRGTVAERVDSASLATLKEQLLALLCEGRRLEKQCLDEESPLPIEPAEHWRKRTYALLEGQTAKYIADINDEPGFEPIN